MNKYAAMRFALRPGMVARLLADLYGVLALLTLVPAVVAACSDRGALSSYLVVSALMGGCWLAGRLLPRTDYVQKNETLAVVALLFLTVSLLFALPVMAYGVPFIDAWFEAVSGVTTTGLSTLNVASMPTSQLFARGWMQWLGGLGVVVLALAMFIRSGPPSAALGFSRLEMDDVVGGTRAHARRVIEVYLLLTATGIIALLLTGAAPLDAVVHCMSAVSTGGFANREDSLAGVPGPRLAVISLLCVAGAVSFHLYYRALFRPGRGKMLDSQMYALLFVIAAGSAVVWLLATLTSLPLAPGDILALLVAAQTTAGFSSVDPGTLPGWLLLLLCLSMAVGGGIGSTAGGLKLGRVLVLARMLRLSLLRPAVPAAVRVASSAGSRRFEAGDVEEVLSLLGWFLLTLALSWLAFLLYGYDPLPALFEVTSALATAGLSTGLSSAGLPATLKVVLCCNMLLGRVEILAMAILLSPHSWFGHRRRYGRRA